MPTHDANLAQLMSQFRPMALRLAGKRLPDSFVADAVQECMVALWATVLPLIQSPRFRGTLPALVACVFRRVIVRQLRMIGTEKRGGKVTHETVSDAIIETQPGPLAILIGREQLAHLLETADPLLKQIITLTGEGWTPAEIDQVLKLSKGRAKALLSQFRLAHGHRKARSVEQRTLIDDSLIATFPSLRAAGRATGIPPENIGMATRGKIKQAGKFRWRLVRADVTSGSLST